MATTKIWDVSAHVSKLLAYVANKNKTTMEVDRGTDNEEKIEIYYNAVGIIDLPTVKEDDCIALHGRCKGKKIAV